MNAAAACTGQPLSWLVLERLALAELEGAAARAADAHLAECAACRAALGTITGDRRALPPLPELPDLAAIPDVRWWRRPRNLAAAGALLAAAVILLAVLVRKPDDELVRRVRVKGAGTVAMTLVRERGGAIAFDPPDVRDDDRWKVQLTCAPGGAVWAETIVYQRGQPPAPALAPQRVACGNAVVLAGAFRITGGAATICLRLLPDGPRPLHPGTLPPRPDRAMACAALTR